MGKPGDTLGSIVVGEGDPRLTGIVVIPVDRFKRLENPMSIRQPGRRMALQVSIPWAVRTDEEAPPGLLEGNGGGDGIGPFEEWRERLTNRDLLPIAPGRAASCFVGIALHDRVDLRCGIGGRR